MLGRMCRIPVGMNELALLPRAFSTSEISASKPLMLHRAESWEQPCWLEGGGDVSVLEEGEGSGKWRGERGNLYLKPGKSHRWKRIALLGWYTR